MTLDRYALLPMLITLVVVALAAAAIGCARVASSGVLIEYRRTGGFAGLDERLVISETCRATLTQKTGRDEFVIARERCDRLVQQFVQADFTRLKSKYLPASTCCDLFEYTVTYHGHTVRTMDTAVPEALQPVLNTLNEIIKSRGRP